MWPFGAAHGAVVGPAPVTSGQSLADMTRSDDVVGRVAQFGASTSRERGSNVVPTTRGNGRRGAEWPESLRGGSWGPGSTPGVQTGGAERSGPSSVTETSPRRGPRTADDAPPSPDGASPPEAPGDGGESARRSTHPRYPKSERTHPEAPTPKGRLEHPRLASNTPRARQIWFST